VIRVHEPVRPAARATIQNAAFSSDRVEQSAELKARLVGHADNEIILQSPTIARSPQRTWESKPELVLKLAGEILLERDAPTEALAPEPSPTFRARPVIRLADAELVLAAHQPPPPAPDLPVPREPPALAAEQRAELEEIEAFELDLKPINAMTARTTPEAGEMPKNYAAARFAREGAIAHGMGFSRTQTETVMMWEVPAICHRPLYFEDINLERHGSTHPTLVMNNPG
jgi:hypothetical protein